VFGGRFPARSGGYPREIAIRWGGARPDTAAAGVVVAFRHGFGGVLAVDLCVSLGFSSGLGWIGGWLLGGAD
jgi:hypothetical protein